MSRLMRRQWLIDNTAQVGERAPKIATLNRLEIRACAPYRELIQLASSAKFIVVTGGIKDKCRFSQWCFCYYLKFQFLFIFKRNKYIVRTDYVHAEVKKLQDLKKNCHRKRTAFASYSSCTGSFCTVYFFHSDALILVHIHSYSRTSLSKG